MIIAHEVGYNHGHVGWVGGGLGVGWGVGWEWAATREAGCSPWVGGEGEREKN